MLSKGEEIYDERFGERYTILRTSEETGGELVRVEDVAGPGESRRPASAHPNQEERFEVVSGTLGLMVDGEDHLLGSGEVLVVPPESRHLPRNAGEGEVCFVAEVRPAGRFEEFLEGITAANNSGLDGIAYLLTVAQVLHRFPDIERPTSMPRALEHALFAVLAATGRLLGLHIPGERVPKMAD